MPICLTRNDVTTAQKFFILDRNPTTMEKYLKISLQAWKDAVIDDADLINTYTELAAWLEEMKNG